MGNPEQATSDADVQPPYVVAEIRRLDWIVTAMRALGVTTYDGITLGPAPSPVFAPQPEPNDEASQLERIRARIRHHGRVMYAASGSALPEAEVDRLARIELKQLQGAP